MIEHLARQAAAIWQQLDDLRIQHNDFQTENFLVDPQGKLWLIDFERLRRYRRREQVRRKQVRDINDLLHPRNWRADPQAGELFRREILQTRAASEALADDGRGAHPLRRPVDATNRPSQLITVLIPCHNAADTIVACLKSVRDMADEILVADAGSTDNTLSLVRRFGGCRIIQKQSGDAAEFESWACQQARHPWILRVLPTEQVNSELGREVQDLLATEPPQDAFLISRSLYFRGHPLKHGGFERDSSLRLFRKNAVRFEVRDGKVEIVSRFGHAGPLRYPLAHESCSDIRLYVGDMMRICRGCRGIGRVGRPSTEAVDDIRTGAVATVQIVFAARRLAGWLGWSARGRLISRRGLSAGNDVVGASTTIFAFFCERRRPGIDSIPGDRGSGCADGCISNEPLGRKTAKRFRRAADATRCLIVDLKLPRSWLH